MPATSTATPPPNRDPAAAAAKPGPDARAHADRLGLGDPARFVTIPRVPILDAHRPIKKTVKALGAVSPDNPDGLVEMMLTCEPGELEDAARNSNRRAAAGRPAILQIGHTQFEDRPEAFHPKAIGFADNFAVGDMDGVPHLFADVHYRREFREDVLTHPRLSVERAAWVDPDQHTITAVALIRRPPERDLPHVPYQAETPPATLCCYARSFPLPGGRPAGAKTRADADRQKRIDMLCCFNITAAEARMHVERGTAPDHSRRHVPPPPPPRPGEVVAYALRHSIFDAAWARADFIEARKKGLA